VNLCVGLTGGTTLRGRSSGRENALHQFYAKKISASENTLFTHIIAKFFDLIIYAGYVLSQFGISYTVPLLKCNAGYTKKLSVQDLGGFLSAPCYRKFLSIAYCAGLVLF